MLFKKIGKGFLYLLLSFVGLIIIAFILVFQFQDKLKSFAIAELNKKLKGELVIKKEISVSIFKHFPNASITLHEVILNDKNKNHPPFITAENIDLGFNTWQLIHQNYSIDAVFMTDAKVNVIYYKNGETNYDVLKQTEKSNGNSTIKINKIGLENIQLTVENKNNNYFLIAIVKSFEGNGNFKEKTLNINWKSNFSIQKPSSSIPKFCFEKNILLKGIVKINTINNDLIFENSSLEIAENKFVITGNLVASQKIELKIVGEKLALKNLINFLPDKQKEKLVGTSSNGELAMEADLKSDFNNCFSLKSDFNIKNGTLHLANWKNDFQKIDLIGNAIIENKKWKIEVINMQSEILGQVFQSTMSMQNLRTNYSINASINGVLNVRDLLQSLSSEKNNNADGVLNFKHFELKCLFNENFVMQQLKAKNEIEFKQIIAEIDNWKIENATGKINADDELISISPTKFLLNENEITIDGKYIFENNIISKNAAQINVSANKININSLIKESKKNEEVGSNKWLDFPLQLHLNCKEMDWNKLVLNNVQADFYLKDSLLSIEQFYTETQDGKLQTSGKMINKINTIPFQFNAEYNDLNISKSFEQFENFNQNIITDKKIKGNLSGSTVVSGKFNKNFEIVTNSISAVSNFSITNGALNNVTQLLNLSKYLKVDDLKNLQFSTLKNQIEINNGKIIIPEMRIQNNALGINISGVHNFENEYEYIFKVNLMNWLGKKLGKNKDENWENESDKSGFNIFLKMIGKGSEFKISRDKKSSREKFKENMKAEQETMKSLILQELQGEKKKEKPIDFKPQEKIELIDWNDTIK